MQILKGRYLLLCTALLFGGFALPAQAQNLPGTAIATEQVNADTQLLFQLAAMFDPDVFSGGSGWRLYDGYTYQYFAFSRTYAGVKNGQVFVMGGSYGNQITSVGTLSDVLALLLDRTDANVITLSRDKAVFEYTPGSATLPTVSVDLDAPLPTGWSLVPGAGWISVSRPSGTTGSSGNVSISVNTSAANLRPGMHQSSVLVRNLSDHNLSVHLPVVLYVTDPGVAVTTSVADVFDFDVTAMVSDAKHGRLYFSDEYSKRVYQVDAASGLTTRYFQFDKVPERMTVSPDGNKLYVALLNGPHNYYLPPGTGQNGAIGIINLETQVSLGYFPIEVDPYDLVVNSQGKLVIASGSGQWTEAHMYDALSGRRMGAVGSVRHLSRLALHPNQQWVYSADTDSSPSDFEKYDMSGDGLVRIGDLPYHGTYRVDGNIWAAPNGRHLYTRGGTVFLATSMLYVTSLDGLGNEAIADLGFDIPGNTAVILTDSNKLLRYGLGDFRLVGTVATDLVDPKAIEVIDGEVYVVDFITGEYRLKRY